MPTQYVRFSGAADLRMRLVCATLSGRALRWARPHPPACPRATTCPPFRAPDCGWQNATAAAALRNVTSPRRVNSIAALITFPKGPCPLTLNPKPFSLNPELEILNPLPRALDLKLPGP